MEEELHISVSHVEQYLAFFPTPSVQYSLSKQPRWTLSTKPSKTAIL